MRGQIQINEGTMATRSLTMKRYAYMLAVTAFAALLMNINNINQEVPPVVTELPKAIEPIKQIELQPVAQAAPVEVPKPAPKPAPPPAPSGSCRDWIAAAGISQIDAAHTLIMRESGCRPTATNSIGCIGLGQNCPDKNGNYWLVQACPDWRTNPVCQMQRFNVYVVNRYGSWSAALQHSYTFNWY